MSPSPSPEESSRAVHVRRLQWGSRRGLLELDLFFADFAREILPTFDDQALEAYERLLFEDDNTLLEWLHDRAHPEDPTLVAVVNRIREFRLTPRNA